MSIRCRMMQVTLSLSQSVSLPHVLFFLLLCSCCCRLSSFCGFFVAVAHLIGTRCAVLRSIFLSPRTSLALLSILFIISFFVWIGDDVWHLELLAENQRLSELFHCDFISMFCSRGQLKKFVSDRRQTLGIKCSIVHLTLAKWASLPVRHLLAFAEGRVEHGLHDFGQANLVLF